MSCPRDQDRGWAWVVLLMSSVGQMLMGTLVMSIGLFQVEFLEHFSEGSTGISLLTSVFLGLSLMLGPVSSLICNTFSIRMAMIVGGLFLSVGLFASAFISNLMLLLVTFGILGGLGLGIAYTPVNVIIGHYFIKKRAVANGISVSACGLGFAFGPYFTLWLLENFGWRHSLAILSCCTLQLCVVGSTYFPLVPEKTRTRREGAASPRRNKTESRFWFLVHPFWWIVCLNYSFEMIGWGIHCIHLPAYAKANGVATQDLAGLFVVFGVAVTLSRMLCGFLCNDAGVSLLVVCAGIQGVQGVITVLMPLYATSYTGILVYQVLMAVYFGAAFIPITPLMVQLFGEEKLNTVFGWVMMFGGFGGLIGPTIGGLIYDLTTSYSNGFHIAGCFEMTGSVILLLIPIFSAKLDIKVEYNEDKCKFNPENQTFITEVKDVQETGGGSEQLLPVT